MIFILIISIFLSINKRRNNERFTNIIFNGYDKPPDIKIPNDGYYTIIMLDPDAPDPNNPYLKNWLHYLVVNKTNSSEDIIKQYTPPSPPIGIHRYITYIYKQPGIINVNEPNREKFDLEKFVDFYKLKKISEYIYKK